MILLAKRPSEPSEKRDRFRLCRRLDAASPTFFQLVN